LAEDPAATGYAPAGSVDLNIRVDQRLAFNIYGHEVIQSVSEDISLFSAPLISIGEHLELPMSDDGNCVQSHGTG
jgi:hypothetical protein